MRVYRKANLIFLWGRSMGAVTSLLYAKIDFSVAGLVLDSPFAKLKDVMINLAKKHSNAPVFLMKMLLSIVRRTIKERAQFDIKDLKLKPVA